MNSIVIAGGGVAGLTLGIALRRKGVPVTLFEAGEYPRHRVCGEFISGQGQAVLKRLNLHETIGRAGASTVQTAAFYSARRCYMRHDLPSPAVAISRHRLDASLAAAFQDLAGELHTKTAWKEDFHAPGVVRATGRRRAVPPRKRRWFGVKAHARDVPLEADLEMHFFRSGYIGLCRLADGLINVCGLFWAEGPREARTAGLTNPVERAPQAWLQGPEGTIVHKRLKDARWEPDSFCAVAALPLHARLNPAEASVGDAVAMVPPLTGNGMSFGFECAELACEPLACFARNPVRWQETVRQLNGLYRQHFGRRLFWANRLHQTLVSYAPLAVLLGLRNQRLWRWAFQLTR